MNDPNAKALSGIPVTELKEMVQTFYDYSKENKLFTRKDDHVRSVWFAKDQVIRMFERFIEEDADGLRVYFGRYPADVSNYINPKPDPNTNSIIFVSTGSEANGAGPKEDYFTDYVPFEPENRGEQCQPKCNGATIVPVG